MSDDVGVMAAAVDLGKIEAHGHASWIGVIGIVGDLGETGRIRKSHSDRGRTLVEVCRLAQGGCFGSGCKVATDKDTSGMGLK